MQPETPQAGKTVNPESDVNGEAVTLAKLPTTESSSAQRWRQTGREFSEQIALLLDRAKEVFSEYKPAIIAIALALAAMPFLAFIVALLRVINVLPLLAPTLKLVGFGFTAWFVYRYLLFAPNRQEFSEELQSLRKQVLGGQNSQLTLPETVPTQAQTSPDTSELAASPEPDSEVDSETPVPDTDQTPPNRLPEDGLKEDPTEKREGLLNSQAELKEPEADNPAERA